jgi:hypothetical protein
LVTAVCNFSVDSLLLSPMAMIFRHVSVKSVCVAESDSISLAVVNRELWSVNTSIIRSFVPPDNILIKFV